MIPEQLAQYGSTIFAIGAIVAIIKVFLANIKEKDQRFINVIENHFHSDLESREKLGEKLEKMGDQIEKNSFITEKLVKWLRRNNS